MAVTVVGCPWNEVSGGIGGGSADPFEQVPVDVAGDPDGAVPEPLRHDRQVDTGGKLERGAEVPQVVQADRP
jgi:hypothetical protein